MATATLAFAKQTAIGHLFRRLLIEDILTYELGNTAPPITECQPAIPGSWAGCTHTKVSTLTVATADLTTRCMIER